MILYKCGIKVITEMQKIEGMITCISIMFDKVQYEISYFLNGEYKSAWLHKEEFTVENKERQKIGFK